MAITFGERLKALRVEQGLNQSEVGEIFGLSPSAIGSYERNLREPAYEHLLGMAEYFGVSVDYLLGKTEERMSTAQMINKIEWDYNEIMNKFNIKVGPYVLTPADKQRLCDVTAGFFANKMISQ